MREVRIAYHAITDWSEPGIWTGYFQQAERILGGALTHLDSNDPVRRRVSSLEEAGRFACAFGPEEQDRWLFGKFKGAGIEFSIFHHRRLDRWHNMCNWHVPDRYASSSDRWERIGKLFLLGNDRLRPFYSYADDGGVFAALAARKKVSGAVDIQTELLGIFWLTYINSAYVRFFGSERVAGLPGVTWTADGGAVVKLGETPESISQDDRDQAMAHLGRKSFVDLTETGVKPRGRFALTFEQLRSESRP